MPRISLRPKLSFTQQELDYLTKLSRSRNQTASIVERSKIVLLSYQGKNDTEISRELKVDYKTVREWIKRVLDLGIKEGLVDKSRSGRPQDISAESRAWVVSLACMKPKDLGYPQEIWTQRLLVEYIRENCITEKHPDLSKINQGTISKILNASKIKPHKISCYIAKVDPDFDQKAANVLGTYREAKRLSEKKEKRRNLNSDYFLR
jgi:putative transposase